MSFRRENLHPGGLPKRIVGGHLLYAPVVTVEDCKLVFVSGLLARDAAGNNVGQGDMSAQIRRIGENLRIALAAAGATIDDIVRTTTYVTDIEDFFRHIDARQEAFGRALPTSTTVEVRRLAHPDYLVEVEAFAAIART